jgi:hypothetical protein
MPQDEQSIPNVWICLQKLRGYVDGTYNDKEDVYLCLDVMEKMFKEIDLELELPAGVGQERRCPNGHPK